MGQGGRAAGQGGREALRRGEAARRQVTQGCGLSQPALPSNMRLCKLCCSTTLMMFGGGSHATHPDDRTLSLSWRNANVESALTSSMAMNSRSPTSTSPQVRRRRSPPLMPLREAQQEEGHVTEAARLSCSCLASSQRLSCKAAPRLLCNRTTYNMNHAEERDTHTLPQTVSTHRIMASPTMVSRQCSRPSRASVACRGAQQAQHGAAAVSMAGPQVWLVAGGTGAA